MMDQIITLSEFLKQFPWTQEELSPGNVCERLWHYDLMITDDQLWPLICNSNIINKASGTKLITYRESGNLLYGSTGKDETREEWIEYPWEWVYCKWAKRVRKYTLSLISYNRAIYLIEKREKGIRLYIYIGSTFKNPAHGNLISQFIDKLEPKYLKTIKKFENDVLEGEQIHAIEQTQDLDEQVKKLLVPYEKENLNVKLAAKLLKYLLTAEEEELGRIRIVPLARSWNVNLDELLNICLYACEFGQLQLSWDTICPHCRGVRQENPYLSQLPLSGHCDICEIDYSTSSQGSVEVVFHIHPSVREVKKIFYCAAEPHHKLHIKVQEHITPGETKHIEVDLPQAQYRSRFIGNAELPVSIHQSPVGEPHRQHWDIEIQNIQSKPFTFIFEDKHFDLTNFLMPQYLFNNSVFRKLFSWEQLPLDLNMDIGLQALVFADIVQSTKLYQELGDVLSFNKIRALMKDIFGIVEEHQGVVIKTMGDGAMFAFNDALNAIKASVNLQAMSENSSGLKLRIALNYGQCIAVNFDYKIDYFGQTVNLASKLQSGSAPSDLVIAKSCFDVQEVNEYLHTQGLNFEECEVMVPGANLKLRALRIHSRERNKSTKG